MAQFLTAVETHEGKSALVWALAGFGPEQVAQRLVGGQPGHRDGLLN